MNSVQVKKAKWSPNWLVKDLLTKRTYVFNRHYLAQREADRLARHGLIFPFGLCGVNLER